MEKTKEYMMIQRKKDKDFNHRQAQRLPKLLKKRERVCKLAWRTLTLILGKPSC